MSSFELMVWGQGAKPGLQGARARAGVLCLALVGVGVVSCIGFGLAGCKREEAAASQPPKEAAPLVKVRTAPVVEQPMPEFLVLTGSLRADQESNLAADANGKVLQILVERGQAVTRGQVIATLDARAASLGATAAEAQAHLAQSQLEQSQKEGARGKHLLETGAI